MSITLDNYMIYAIENRLIHNWGWVTSMLGIHSNAYSNEYIKIEDNVGYVIVDNEPIEFIGYIPGDAFIRIGDVVNIDKEFIKSLDSNYKTIMGRFLINYLLIEHPFKGKLKYIKGDIDISKFMELIRVSLSDDLITVDEYKVYVISCTFLEEFNKLVTPTATSKLLVPPPGLKAFKAKIKKELIDKHGSNWGENPVLVVEYDNALKGYYNDYLKGDASDGVVASGKTRDNALSKKYLTFSSTNAFGEQVHIEESLLDGYPKDPDKLVAMFNTIRHGSHSRGSETQKGGGVAKSVLRATNSVKIVPEDCGVTYGKNVLVTKNTIDSLIGRYIIVNSKPVKLTNDNINQYVNKIIVLRSPMYCKTHRPNRCSVCMGERASRYPNGVSLIVTNISSVLTLSSLKVIHNNQISTVKVDMSEIVS